MGLKSESSPAFTSCAAYSKTLNPHISNIFTFSSSSLRRPPINRRRTALGSISRLQTMWVGVKASARSNVAMIPKLFNWVSNLCETQVGPMNLGLRRLSSSINDNIHGKNSKNEGLSEQNEFKNDNADESILGKVAEGGLDNPYGPPQPDPDAPTVETFAALVDTFCKEKGVEEARKVIDALKKKGFFQDEELKVVTERLNKKD